jgi:hypothetical protein
MILIAFVPTTTGVMLVVGGEVEGTGFPLDDFEDDPEHPLSTRATNATTTIPNPVVERRL